MQLTRRRTRSILSTVIPLLALVWASLPLHRCNLAFADPVPSVAVTTAAAAAGTAGGSLLSHCGHLVADAAQPAKATMSCSDLVRAAPDLRPAVAVDTLLVHVSFDSRWRERGLRPVSLFGGTRPLDDGQWRLRPLHLQKSVLLI